jgi:hypothetical protein
MDKLKANWEYRINKFYKQFQNKIDEPDKTYTNQKVEGYWYSKHEPDYPMPIPNILTEDEANEIYDLMLKKQKEAKINKYMGVSMSRLTDEMLGSVEYELNGWIWTGNLDKHYVKEHRVKPSDEFLSFIEYPNKNETKATLKIEYNVFKSMMRVMVDEMSKEIDKNILTNLISKTI